MPKFAVSYSPAENITLRALTSKGYSLPTTAEIRPSGTMINYELQPESGWNNEFGFRIRTDDNTFNTDVSVFVYNLTNAITRRTTADDTEFFINSGGIIQKGIELQSSYRMPGIFSGKSDLLFRNGVTINDFRFRNYTSGTKDLSDKKITGVPDLYVSSSVEMILNNSWSLTINHYYTGIFFLNDLTEDKTNASNVFGLKALKYIRAKKNLFEIYFQLENFTNEKYSSGYDLNAFGGRYYNPSPPLNFTAGILLKR
jgi:iron complex outermembrane receptor protein